MWAYTECPRHDCSPAPSVSSDQSETSASYPSHAPSGSDYFNGSHAPTGTGAYNGSPAPTGSATRKSRPAPHQTGSGAPTQPEVIPEWTWKPPKPEVNPHTGSRDPP